MKATKTLGNLLRCAALEEIPSPFSECDKIRIDGIWNSVGERHGFRLILPR